MLNRDRARWALASLIAVAVLSAPAIWNRFPLLQWDTGGYIARWYEHSLVISRSRNSTLLAASGRAIALRTSPTINVRVTVFTPTLPAPAGAYGTFRAAAYGRSRSRSVAVHVTFATWR